MGHVPTLVIRGDSDRIAPFSAAGQRTAKLIKGAELVVVTDGPHNVAWTHAEEVNAALLLASTICIGRSARKETPASR
jgi:pimeloyl-ACP methyl ester carboxylesterase